MLMNHLAAVCFLYGVGLPVARVIVRSHAFAWFLAPLCTGLLCVAAALASLATGTALAPWLVGTVLAAWVAAGRRWWSVLRHAEPGATPTRPPLWAAAVVAVISAPALLATRAGAIEWDARSIWWFHAAWFRQGGTAARAAMNNRAFGFAHPDYPPFAPATEASMWTLWHDLDRMLAKAVSAHLTFAAVALLSCLLVRLAPAGRRLSVVSAVVAGAFGLAMFGVGNGNGTSGVVDLLWAVLLAVGAVALLIAPRDRDVLVVGWVAIAAAGLTKNEALPAIALVLALVAIRNRRAWRHTLWASSAVLPTMAWTVLRAALTGGSNDAFTPSGMVAFLRGESARTARLAPTLEGVWEQIDSTAMAWVVVALVGALVLRRARTELGLGAAWLLPTLVVGIASALTLVYVAGEPDITWWLMTSISRTTIVLRVLLLVDVCLWVLAAGAASDDRAPEPGEIGVDTRA